MKSIFGVFALIAISSNAFAAAPTVALTSCRAVMDSWDDTPKQVVTDIQVFKDKAVITQSKDSVQNTYEQSVQIVDGAVRPDLDKIAKAEIDASASNPFDDEKLNLNVVENNVLFAMIIQMETPARTGIDLTQVASGRAYLIGNATSMGQAMVIEVKNSKGEALGSFLSGLLIAPCQK